MSRSACNSRAAADAHPARRHGPIITPRAVLAAALLGLFPATALAGSGETAERLARLSSTTFDRQLAVAEVVAQENPRLYFEIQRRHALPRRPAIVGMRDRVSNWRSRNQDRSWVIQ